MIESLILIEGNNLKEEILNISLQNAKHLVIGKVPGSGWILHVAANSSTNLSEAILSFSQIPDVTGVLTLTLRSS